MTVFPTLYVPLEGGTVSGDRFKQGVRAIHDGEEPVAFERQVGLRLAHVTFRDGGSTYPVTLARRHDGRVLVDHPEFDDDDTEAVYDRLWSRLVTVFHG